jgi:hypothetical protein
LPSLSASFKRDVSSQTEGQGTSLLARRFSTQIALLNLDFSAESALDKLGLIWGSDTNASDRQNGRVHFFVAHTSRRLLSLPFGRSRVERTRVEHCGLIVAAIGGGLNGPKRAPIQEDNSKRQPGLRFFARFNSWREWEGGRGQKGTRPVCQRQAVLPFITINDNYPGRRRARNDRAHSF